MVDKNKLTTEEERELAELEELEVLEAEFSQRDNDNLSAVEEVLAYPYAAIKGATLGLDKYAGAIPATVESIAKGEGANYSKNVEEYEKMRNRLIENGGVLPQTTELGASMVSPVKMVGAYKAATPLVQSMIYGATEADDAATGAAIGGGTYAGLIGAGKASVGGAKIGSNLLSKISEILGGDVKGVASAIASKTPLTTTEERITAQMAVNKDSERTASDVLDKVSQRKFEQGLLIDEAFSHLDKKVGKTIPATEITGYLREADKVANDWKGVPFKASESASIYGKKPAYTGIVTKDTGKDINVIVDEVSGRKYFMPENITKKARFADKLVTVTDNLNFQSPQSKAEYQAKVVDMANKTDDAIQAEITRAMDGRVTEASSKKSIDSIENEFYNKVDSLNKKYIQNLTPSELRSFRDEIYNAVNYGTSKIKGRMGGQRISLDVSPAGAEGKMFEGELKSIGRKAKDTLEKYAEYHGIPLRDINKQYKTLSDVEEFLPDAINIKNIADPSVLSRASMDKDAAIAMLRESGENDIANYLESSLSDIFRRQSDIAITSRVGGEITPIVRIPEQVMARAGNLMQRKAVTPLMQSLKKVEPLVPSGSILPYAAGAVSSSYGRKPQSIEEVAYMKIPRSTEAVIASPELFLEKVRQLDPASLPVVQHAINEDPEKLPDIMFAMSQQFPQAFDNDKYGRFDGKIPAATMMNYINDLRIDGSISNTEKAKVMNDVLKKKIAHYSPQ